MPEGQKIIFLIIPFSLSPSFSLSLPLPSSSPLTYSPLYFIITVCPFLSLLSSSPCLLSSLLLISPPQLSYSSVLLICPTHLSFSSFLLIPSTHLSSSSLLLISPLHLSSPCLLFISPTHLSSSSLLLISPPHLYFRFLEQQNIADLAIIPAREARERLYKLFRCIYKTPNNYYLHFIMSLPWKCYVFASKFIILHFFFH